MVTHLRAILPHGTAASLLAIDGSTTTDLADQLATHRRECRGHHRNRTTEAEPGRHLRLSRRRDTLVPTAPTLCPKVLLGFLVCRCRVPSSPNGILAG